VGEVRNSYKNLVGKSEWRVLLERPRRRWEYNFKCILKKWGVIDDCLMACSYI